jgi:hypothetical protein
MGCGPECIYGDEIKETRDNVRKIHDALLGKVEDSGDKPGIITRVSALEKSHKLYTRMFYSSISLTFGGFVAALFIHVFSK